MDSLDLIRRPIKDDLQRFRNEFESSLQHSNPLLDSVLKLVSSRKGKMMRPMLTLLCARLFGEVNQKTINAACTFEFFHTASLLHDDVVDESDQRRGQKSVNDAYSNQIAVLVGDYMLALALKNSALTGITRLIDVFSLSAMKLADGEIVQLDNVNNTAISEDVYFHIIKNKTAALFASCAESGALTVGASEEDLRKLYEFGETIGICFQIRDDIFDYSDDASIGKPTGNDMKEGKLTLPVIYALNSTGNAEMLSIAKDVKGGEACDADIKRLVSFTKENGGIEYAQKVMNEYADKAKDILACYDDSEVKEALFAYVDFVVGRSV